MSNLSNTEIIWLVIGFSGQLLFSGRFLIQWITSERKGQSVVPKSFWLLSISGSALLLSYAIYRLDPVFIVAQSFGFVVYFRNLQLLRKEQLSS